MSVATTLRSRPAATVAGVKYTRTARISSQFLKGGDVVWLDGGLINIGGVGVRGEGFVTYRAYDMRTDTHLLVVVVSGAKVAQYDAI